MHKQAHEAGVSVSLATVYNSLHQFTQAGLLREVVVEPGRSYFDTNVNEHHHFYLEDTGELVNITRTFEPIPENVALYEERFRLYRQYYRRNRKWYRRLNADV